MQDYKGIHNRGMGKGLVFKSQSFGRELIFTQGEFAKSMGDLISGAEFKMYDIHIFQAKTSFGNNYINMNKF